MFNVGRFTPVFRQTGEGKLENPGGPQLVSVTFVFFWETVYYSCLYYISSHV